MTSIYLGNWHLFPSPDLDLPEVDPVLSLGQSIGIWPIPDSLSTDIPEPGDYVVFIAGGGDVYGIGRIGDVTTQPDSIEYAHRLLDQEELNDSIGSVATIVQYQETEHQYRGGRPNLADVFEGVDSDKLDAALQTGFPPGRNWVLQKIPERIWSSYRSPSLVLGNIHGIDTSAFYSNPNGGRGPNRNYNSEEFDEDGGDIEVDRTGTLLEQGYAGREAVRESSKSSLQISVLLFGIIVASLSVFRDEIEAGIVDLQTPLIWGGLLIATGAVLAALVFVYTTVRPRPYADIIADKQSGLNTTLPGIHSEEKQQLIAEFSRRYHDVVNKVGAWNTILGGVVGAAVGLALGGVFLSTLAIIFQVGMGMTITIGVIIGVSVLVVGLTIYGAYFAYEGSQQLDENWISIRQ